MKPLPRDLVLFHYSCFNNVESRVSAHLPGLWRGERVALEAYAEFLRIIRDATEGNADNVTNDLIDQALRSVISKYAISLNDRNL